VNQGETLWFTGGDAESSTKWLRSELPCTTIQVSTRDNVAPEVIHHPAHERVAFRGLLHELHHGVAPLIFDFDSALPRLHSPPPPPQEKLNRMLRKEAAVAREWEALPPGAPGRRAVRGWGALPPPGPDSESRARDPALLPPSGLLLPIAGPLWDGFGGAVCPTHPVHGRGPAVRNVVCHVPCLLASPPFPPPRQPGGPLVPAEEMEPGGPPPGPCSTQGGRHTLVVGWLSGADLLWFLSFAMLSPIAGRGVFVLGSGFGFLGPDSASAVACPQHQAAKEHLAVLQPGRGEGHGFRFQVDLVRPEKGIKL